MFVSDWFKHQTPLSASSSHHLIPVALLLSSQKSLGDIVLSCPCLGEDKQVSVKFLTGRGGHDSLTHMIVFHHQELVYISQHSYARV
jgi:hypothetical protein